MSTITWAIGFFTLFFTSLSQAYPTTSSSFMPSTPFSDSSCFLAPSTLGHLYLGTTVGASHATLSKGQPRISYESGVLITDAYPLNNNHSWSGILGLNCGYEFKGSYWKPSIALGIGFYFNPGDLHFKGNVIETAAGDASSMLYHYEYKIHCMRAMAEMRLTWKLHYLSPFISVGIGSAWNRAKSYKETAATNSGYPPLPPFHSHTDLNFAYQAGLGISFAFNWGNLMNFLHERISVRYNYVHSGTTSFSKRGSAYPYRLHIGTLSSSEVYFNYTHLF